MYLDITRNNRLTVVVICVIRLFRPITTFMRLFVGYFNGNFVTFLFVGFCAILFRYFVAFWDFVVATVLLRHLMILGDLDIMALFLWDFIAFLTIVVAWLTVLLVMG